MTTATASHRTKRGAGGTSIGYVPALDGLRAYAVLAVMAYHAGVGWAGGGFLGVDTFFVLSGFLITTLLVTEWGERGTISLGGFWSRRARRLLPALFLVLIGVAAYARWLAPPDTLPQLRGDALATLGYAANWHQVAVGQGYFAQAAYPSPLLHTWSLAIEEQFYIVWPLVVLGLLRWRRSLNALLVLAVVGAVASAAEMALLFHPGGDPSRLYYGTDSRAQSLLIGAALAVVLAGRSPTRSRGGRGTTAITGLIGAAFMAWALVHASGSTPWLYQGGFALDGLAVAGLIGWLVMDPSGPGARLLSLTPVRYVGRISYGLYLWHWPIFLLIDHARTGLLGWRLLAVRFAITFAVAVLSFHLVEQPIRRGALSARKAWTLTPAVVGATAAAVVVGTVPALPVVAATNLAKSVAAVRTLPSYPPGSSVPVNDLVSFPPVPPPPAKQVRLLVVGDSMAFSLGLPLQELGKTFGISVALQTLPGCGLAEGGLVLQRGLVEQVTYGLFVRGYTPCTNQYRMWRSAIDHFHPDVVALLDGPWEVRNRTLGSRWTHIGDPVFNALEGQRIEQAIGNLSVGGATVALLTCPYLQEPEGLNGTPWPEDNPARVDIYNSLLYQAAAQNPATAVVVPLAQPLSPGGVYQPVIDGVRVRDSDGLHLTSAGVQWLAPWLLPILARLGEPHAMQR